MIVMCVYFSGFIANGMVSGSIYKQSFFPRTSPGWQRVMVISASIIPSSYVFSLTYIAILLIIYTLLCCISLYYGTLTSFPLYNVLSLLLIVTFVCLPCQVIGTIIGRSVAGNPHYPCRISALPSPIPPAAFYAKPRFICTISGLLPFGSIFIEIFFIFASIWSYKYYYVYGFLAAMILILIIIQVCVSIVGTYVLLNAENYHWRWTSFLSGASIGVYIFFYCVFFYFCKTEMNGFVQAAYFFAESVEMG